ncbi:uncharacterized protein LAJ45_00326 [Morchella importuna]|uniref:uncharacterized protein n=1 Tax=Morchella importuna TaxID=1174673 RepID=UPI001E8D0197|nr:uncharacterized protein LAJ45_00326 [Morchella importuna]KAH8155316.1 hypothetical protein LAJ45_00326 [Morchella importuna]
MEFWAYYTAATANKPEAEEVWVVLEHFVRFKKSFDSACVSITYFISPFSLFLFSLPPHKLRVPGHLAPSPRPPQFS